MIPGVCNSNPETVVLCHAPHPDKGMGHKGPDYFAAYGCSRCHDVLDHHGLPYSEEVEAWHRGVRETQRRLVRKGLLKEA